MTIRKATPADHRAMAEVAAAAFIDDDVFGRFMYPHRREYPDDYIMGWERDFWVKSTEPEREYLVSVDDATGEVAAWACWMRVGPGAATTRQNPISLRLQNIYTTQAARAHAYLYPNRAADPAHVAAFYDSIPLTEHLWSGPRADAWQLDFLCTHPAHERRGHGGALVRWGLAKADDEQIPASVIAAWQRDDYYASFGFREVGRANVGPIAEVKGGAVMFRDVVVPQSQS